MKRASTRRNTLFPTRPLYLRGFTIVELLIVVVIIAILATVTVVAYNSMVARARASQASAALNQAKKKLEIHRIDNNTYPTTGNLASAGITDTNTTFQYDSDGTDYCLTATATNVSYYINSTTQTNPTQGGCPGHGQGGVAAITNLATGGRASQASIEWQARYTMSGTFINGAVDGPTALLTSYMRNTQGAPLTGTGRGVDHRGNVDLGTPAGVDTAWPVATGEKVFVSIYTRSSLTNSNLRMLYKIHNGAGAWVTATQIATSSQNYSSPNTWVRLTGTITAPASGYLSLSTRYETSTTWTTGATIDVTGLMVVKGDTTYSYADPITNASWIWNGATNASTSTGPAL